MRADRLVDLDDDAFRALAPLSVGVIRVVISVIPNPPQTTTDAIQ
jgi:rare lipoprotein A (peptidoglycan hydrolase)